MSSLRDSNGLFFFSQNEMQDRRKRPKRVFDEQAYNNLTKKFNNKFQSTGEDKSRTLTERLGELVTTSNKSVSSANSYASNNRRTSMGPNAFTDTRLQGIYKFLN